MKIFLEINFEKHELNYNFTKFNPFRPECQFFSNLSPLFYMLSIKENLLILWKKLKCKKIFCYC